MLVGDDVKGGNLVDEGMQDADVRRLKLGKGGDNETAQIQPCVIAEIFGEHPRQTSDFLLDFRVICSLQRRRNEKDRLSSAVAQAANSSTGMHDRRGRSGYPVASASLPRSGLGGGGPDGAPHG